MPTQNPFEVVANDVKSAIATTLAGIRWFALEARAAVAWVDKRIPGAQQAIAALFQTADEAASALERHAGAGLADIVARAVDEAGTTVANLISASGLDLTAKATLSAADVAAVTAAKTIAESAISVATAKLLGATAQAAASASAAPAAPAAPAATPVAAH